MRKQLMTALAVLLISAAGASAQATRPAGGGDESSRQIPAFTPSLVGTWSSAPDELKLTSDFDVSVWGSGATSVRTVDLEVRPSGEATLKVTKKVVDTRGRTIAASTSVEQAELQIGESTPGTASRVEHEAKVLSAVRLFPDDPDYTWTMDGLRVKVVTFSDGDDNTIEIRYDTPEGRGSFWETLTRERRGGERRTSR